MRKITGQGILLLYCFMCLMFVPVDTGFVIAFLVSLVCISAEHLTVSDRRRECWLFLFLGVSCFFPEMLLFAPSVLYSFGRWEHRTGISAVLLAVLCTVFYGRKNQELLVFLIFGFLAACFLVCLTEENKRLEETVKRTRDDGRGLNLLLKERNKNLQKQQDDEIYTAKLKERNRIAREIHDNVGHMLSRAILMTGALKAMNREQFMEGALCQLEDTLGAAMTSVRESVHDLHDDSINLKEALTGLVEEYSFCEAALIYDMGYVLPGELKYSFIAIVKEALNNTAKHSNASWIQITAREHPGLYQLVIEDNGKEYETSVTQGLEGEGGGLGLQNMKDRIQALGGTVQIRNEKGFRIYITVPKKEDAA